MNTQKLIYQNSMKSTKITKSKKISVLYYSIDVWEIDYYKVNLLFHFNFGEGNIRMKGTIQISSKIIF